MLRSQEIQVRLSELRTQINAWPEDGSIDGLAALRQESLSLEEEFRRVVREEAERMEAADPIGSDTPENREVNGLYHRARLTRMVAAIGDGREPDGAEAEFRAAVFPDGARDPRSVPLHLFLPLDEGDIEVRADTATTVAADGGIRVTRPIAARVFARTEAAYLGANFVSVGAGRQRFPYVSAGASLTYRDEGTPVDAQAGRITTEDVDPLEASMSYLVGTSSMLRFADGELEASLRSDARMAIEDGVDQTVIQGRAAGTGFTGSIKGLEGELSAVTAAAATVTAGDVLQAYADRVDGKYAYVWSDSRLLVRHEVYGKANFLAIGGASGERLLVDILGPANFRASARLSAPSGGVSDAISYAPMNDRADFLVPSWLDVATIVDPYSYAGSGQVKLTFTLAHNVLMLRNDAWKKHSFKHT